MIPTIREYMDEKLKDMRFGVYQIDGEYSDILYWIKQYCEMVISECAEQADIESSGYYSEEVYLESYRVDRESILDVKNKL